MIRELAAGDFDSWVELWQDYLSFYRTWLPETTTRTTFDRLVSQTDGMLGLVAVVDPATVVGFANIVFHPSTWSETSYCYLEDLFVSPNARRTRVARALIVATYDEADRRGASKVYWQTQEYNDTARSLYDQVAQPTSFIVYARAGSDMPNDPPDIT